MGKPRVHENGLRTGWLYNLYVTTIGADGSTVQEGKKGKNSESQAGADELSALKLLFRDLDGHIFECSVVYNPYFLVGTVDGHEHEVELGISSLFGSQGLISVAQIEKEDLDLINHLSGKNRIFLKLTFDNTNHLTAARQRIEMGLKRNLSMGDENSLISSFNQGFSNNGFFGFNGSSPGANKDNWESWIADIREYDVKYHVRVAIDMNIYVGLWYDVEAEHGKVTVSRCDDSKYPPAMPKICAYDIETTKAPLKFPQPEIDQIYMISYMIDSRGFLIVNREIVTADIAPFEYCPIPEYDGYFETFNEPDEKALLRRFFDEMKAHNPNVYVTYNGDYFDFPFIHARAIFHGMNMRKEIGFAQGAEGATLNREVPHLDCFYWVKRDSYLPQGSQGLKAVTKAKLGFDPIEVDPEEMLPLAQSHPQRMASYSVSDAVSTYYLYMKYVHPFIYSLCTIIPMPPDEVLRKGSGTLCESLLCVQAYAKNVVYPNKQLEVKEKFHNGHLIDSETYIGGRVEALKSGVFRSDIPMDFSMNPEVFTMLLGKLDDMLKFAIEVENNTKLEDVTNYDEVRNEIASKLESLRDTPNISECPLIYHLDVGAMYPNIILTNRLQPSSIVTPEICAGCCFYTPDDEYKCQREMTWVWRGEMFTAGRHEFTRIKNQLESESFATNAIAKADQAATTKKTYGNRKGNVLEGTLYEKKERNFNKSKNEVKENTWGYRQRKNANASLLDNQSDKEGDESDDDGTKKFHRLAENTQFSMLKKRVGEYSRKAYGKTHDTKEMHRTDTVCQRENSFYVDTVRLFRDRRYHYKRELKRWKDLLDKAKDLPDIKECKSRCIQMESLQLAHKCILNSFYGYVMRKGSRWYSMEMAGIVTYLGATLIKMARELVQQFGITLELDTDGIWACLPKTFPENFTFTTKNPKKKISISYPCVMLNKDVQDRYTNHQYQDLVNKESGMYITRNECSIYFEVDGPYLAMILPASREEGKTIKKRYAVFTHDKKLSELKGFELKRRGELMLIKDFQSLVFKRFLDGNTLIDAFASAASVANNSLDLLYSQGEGYDDEEVIEKLTESSNMSRRLSEYPTTQKSLALTTARRISEFLGPQMVKDKGLACSFVISRTPPGKPVTDRAIPLMIFKADPSVRIHFIRKWCGDASLPSDISLKDILDWDYYIMRFQGTVQKIITIPAALQGVENPVPRIKHPDWLMKRVALSKSRFKQISLTSMMKQHAPVQNTASIDDMEDAFLAKSPVMKTISSVKDPVAVELLSDDDDEDIVYDDVEEDCRFQQEKEKEENERLEAFEHMYFRPKSNKILDADFFVGDQFSSWLSKRKAAWSHQAMLRRQIQGSNGGLNKLTNDSTTVDGFLVDIQSKALSTTWNILEIREIPRRVDQVTMFVLMDGTLYTILVNTSWTVIVDADPNAKPIPNSKIINGRVLPRHKDPGVLYEVTVPSTNGDVFVERMQYLREDVRDIYERHITAVCRAVLACGAVASVDSRRHLAHTHKMTRNRGEFELEHLEMGSSAKYLSKLPPYVFLFHATSDSRGVIAAIFQPSNFAIVVIIQPIGAQRHNFNWNSITTEALGAVGLVSNDKKPLDVKVEYASDQKAAFAIVNQAISDSLIGSTSTKPCLAVLQSTWPHAHISAPGAIPQLQNIAVLRTAGGVEDERIFVGNTLSWTRPIVKRMLLRYYASAAWVSERALMAGTSNVPICNLQQDTAVSALDFMFMRALRRHSHVLWDPQGLNYAAEAFEERPREVVSASAHHTWTTEFSISQLEVVSVLFSQMIQEGDDPRSHALCDGGITSHFHVLRDLISDLYGTSATSSRKEAAADLIVSFPRWLKDTQSMCYEPNIVVLVSRLVHRALTALLVRVTKLGGIIAKASPERLMLASNKHSIQDVCAFAVFIRQSLKDHPMLNHLGLIPVKYWAPLLIVDHKDYAGFSLSADLGPTLSSSAKLPDHDTMKFEYSCTIWSRLNEKTKENLIIRLRDYTTLISTVKREAISAVSNEVTTTLATRVEKINTYFRNRMGEIIEDQFQLQVIEDVNNMIMCHVQLVDATSPSDSAGALEYCKVLTHFMSISPEISRSVLKVKNNCLRLCGVGPFAPEATFAPDKQDRALYVRASCSFCSEDCVIHVGAGTTPSQWKCTLCDTPFDKETIQTHYLTLLNRAILSTSVQDFICLKCKRSTNSLISRNCCGELKVKNIGTEFLLDTIEYFSKLHEMPFLLEAVEAARLAY